METVLIRLVDQVPLAFLVGGFAIYLIRLFHKRMDARDELFLGQLSERDKQNQVNNAARDEAFRAGIAAQNEQMRQFWDSQQVSNRDVLERLVRGVENMTAMLQHHDKKFDIAVGTMLERTQDEAPKGLDIPTKPRRKS